MSIDLWLARQTHWHPPMAVEFQEHLPLVPTPPIPVHPLFGTRHFEQARDLVRHFGAAHVKAAEQVRYARARGDVAGADTWWQVYEALARVAELIEAAQRAQDWTMSK